MIKTNKIHSAALALIVLSMFSACANNKTAVENTTQTVISSLPETETTVIKENAEKITITKILPLLNPAEMSSDDTYNWLNEKFYHITNVGESGISNDAYDFGSSYVYANAPRQPDWTDSWLDRAIFDKNTESYKLIPAIVDGIHFFDYAEVLANNDDYILVRGGAYDKAKYHTYAWTADKPVPFVALIDVNGNVVDYLLYS
jgi:hypothetical protein